MASRSDDDYRRLYEECLKEKDQLQAQFTEFQTSSTEFEEELQRELGQAHSETEKAKARIAKLETLVSSVREEAEKISDRSAAEIQALSRSAKEWESKCMQMRLDMRLMEQEKDNLERSCRVAEARAADLEIQVESLEEQCALLQEDVASAQEDHEEELRTMREELKDARSDLIRAQAAIPNQSDTIKSLQRQVSELQNQLEKLMIRHASSPSQHSRKSSRSPNASAHSRQLSSPVPPLHDGVAASVVSALQRRSSVAEPVGRGRSSSIERREAEERARGRATLEVPGSGPRPALSRPATISFPQPSANRVPEFTANGVSHSVPAPAARRLAAVPRQPSIPEDSIEEEGPNHSDLRPFIYLAGTDSHPARPHVFSPMPTTPRSPAPPPPMANRTHSEPSMDHPSLTPSVQTHDTSVLDPMLSPKSTTAEPRDIPSSISVLRRMLSYGASAMHRSLSRSSNGTTPEPHLELSGLSPANTDESRGFTSPFPSRIPDAHTRLPMPNLTRKYSDASDDGSVPLPSFAPPRPPGVTQLNFTQMMPSPASVAKPMPLSKLGKSSTQSALLSRGTPRKPIDRSAGFPLAQVFEAFTPRTQSIMATTAGEALLKERLAALSAATGPEAPPPASSPPPLPHHPPSLRNLHQAPPPPTRSAR